MVRLKLLSGAQDLEGKLQEATAKASQAENRAQAASEALSTVRKRYDPTLAGLSV